MSRILKYSRKTSPTVLPTTTYVCMYYLLPDGSPFDLKPSLKLDWTIFPIKVTSVLFVYVGARIFPSTPYSSTVLLLLLLAIFVNHFPINISTSQPKTNCSPFSFYYCIWKKKHFIYCFKQSTCSHLKILLYFITIVTASYSQNSLRWNMKNWDFNFFETEAEKWNLFSNEDKKLKE